MGEINNAQAEGKYGNVFIEEMGFDLLLREGVGG